MSSTVLRLNHTRRTDSTAPDGDPSTRQHLPPSRGVTEANARDAARA